MTLGQLVRDAVERRIVAIERSLAAIDGLKVERRGSELAVRGRHLVQRSIDDARLRFARLGR